MIETIHRPFTEEERDELVTELLRLSNTSTQWVQSVSAPIVAVLFGAAMGMGLGFLATLLLPPGIPSHFIIPGLALLGAIGSLQLAARGLAYREMKRQRQIVRLARLLERGEMEITRVIAYGAVAFAEDEDESPSFLLDIGAGQTLFVQGAYTWELYTDIDADTPILYSAFDLYRYPDEPEEVARVEPYGVPLQPARLLLWCSFEASTNFTDGEVLSGLSLATLERDFPDLFASIEES